MSRFGFSKTKNSNLCSKALQQPPSLLCFWHGHQNCAPFKWLCSNLEFWNAELNRDLERDWLSRLELEELGWTVFEVLECETDCANQLISLINDCPSKSDADLNSQNWNLKIPATIYGGRLASPV